jgi:hypothetical protein
MIAITTWPRPSDVRADNPFGAVGRRGVDEVDARIDGFEHETGGFVFGLASLEALKPPVPRPATLTRSSVSQRLVYCIAGFSLIQ